MCGNSICQDRRFLASDDADARSVLPLSQPRRQHAEGAGAALAARSCSPASSKAQAHTALADIQESIDELAYYREHFLRAPPVAEPARIAPAM